MAVTAVDQPHRHPARCECVRCGGFTKGNELSMRHGAYRGDAVLDADDRTKELVVWIWETQPVSHPADAGAVERLARVYRRLELAGKALDEADAAIGERAVAAYAVPSERTWLAGLRDDYDRWLSRAGKIEETLGRTPASRARLGVDLATARREMSVIDYYEQRERDGLPLFDDDADGDG